MERQYPCHSYDFLPDVFLYFTWDGCIMGYHVVHLLCCAIEIDDLTTFFIAAGAGLFLVVWPLCGILERLFLEYFSLFRRLPGSMQQEYFPSSWPIYWMAYIFCLALASAALLGVGGRGGFSSLSFPSMNVMVGIFPNWRFRRCYPSV